MKHSARGTFFGGKVSANGEHIKQALLTCRKAGKDQQEYFTIKLSDILVSSYHSGGHGGAHLPTETHSERENGAHRRQGGAVSDVVPMDQFSLNFSKIELVYKEQKADGTLGAAMNAGYDLKKKQNV